MPLFPVVAGLCSEALGYHGPDVRNPRPIGGDVAVKGGPLWNRIAAATGVDFAVAGAVIVILAQVKDFENSNDFIGASNEVWGAYALLLGLSAVFFLWFTSIFSARLRQVEAASDTSGRLANAVLASGAVIAGGFVSAVAAQWTARELGATEIGLLSTAILEGPVLVFPIAAYITAAGICVARADGVAPSSRIIALISLVLGPAYLAIGGVQLFNNYAWMDETLTIAFLAWVFAVSAVGTQRWGAIDEGWQPGRAPAAAPASAGPPPLEPAPLEPLDDDDLEVTATLPRPRKPATRKKKPAKRKPPARKS